MRILHTEWSDGLGGQEKRILTEATGLLERGHYVAIVCRKHSKIINEATKHGIDAHYLPLKKPYDILTIIRLAKFLKANRFDIVNTHSGIDSWIGGIAAKIANIPVLIRTRHLNIPLRKNIFNFIHYLPDIYITCGENMRENLINRCGFSADKVVSIPTGVIPAFFKTIRKPEIKLKYGLSKDSIVIANVGILRSVKGHEITLKAVRKVIKTFLNAKFLIVGDGPRRRELEDMVKNLGISEYVIFTGFVENIPEIYSLADVAILSSWSEGVPQGLLQAMAAGIPVVATKVGGVPEVVVNDETGILVKAGDPESFAKGIIRILKNTSLSLRLAENARNIVAEKYSVSNMLNKLESLYQDLLKEKNI